MATATIASSPFDRKSADVIIRTSDNVDFHLCKEILSVASPFFEDMFSLTQPSTDNSSPNSTIITMDRMLNSEPIVVAEDSKTMDPVLRLCYPVAEPELTTLPLVEFVLEAALKYQLTKAVTVARKALNAFIEGSPLLVFVAACRLRLEEEAKAAAGIWKTQWLSNVPRISSGKFLDTIAGACFIPEMSRISSGCYLRLLYFMGTDPNPPIQFTKRRSPFLLPKTFSFSSSFKNGIVSFKDDLHAFAELGDTDVIVRSYDGADFRVHKIALRFVRGQKLLDEPHTTFVDQDKAELPVYNIEASGDVLAQLLRLCYPAAGMVLEDFTLLRKVVEIATKYDMTMIVQMVKKQLMKSVDDHPLDLYFLAVQCGWDDVAQEAAKAASKLMLEEQYVPEMENTSAEAYLNLLEYRHEYITATSEVVSRHALKAERWKTVGVKAGTKSCNAVPPTLSFALVEAELVKAGNANKCFRCDDHPSSTSGTPSTSATPTASATANMFGSTSTSATPNAFGAPRTTTSPFGSFAATPNAFGAPRTTTSPFGSFAADPSTFGSRTSGTPSTFAASSTSTNTNTFVPTGTAATPSTSGASVYNLGPFVSPAYVLQPEDLLTRNRNLEKEMEEAQSKVTLKITRSVLSG